MSFLRHDLQCADGHRAAGVLYRRSDGLPPCPTCGGATAISWFSGESPGLLGFGTVRTDDGVMTTADLRQKVRDLQAANPGKQVKVESFSDRKTDQRIDERRQRVIDSRKARGIDAQAACDARMDQLYREKEELSRATVQTPAQAAQLATVNEKIEKVPQSYKRTA